MLTFIALVIKAPQLPNADNFLTLPLAQASRLVLNCCKRLACEKLINVLPAINAHIGTGNKVGMF